MTKNSPKTNFLNIYSDKTKNDRKTKTGDLYFRWYKKLFKTSKEKVKTQMENTVV